MTAERFPVLITGYTKHLVWVDAEDAAEAHRIVHDEPYEWVEGNQPIEGWLEGEKDPAETASFIWVYGRDFMPRQDAHVYTHQAEMHRRERSAKQAACTAAGHPDRKAYPDGAIWCNGCSAYLKTEVSA